MRSVGGRKRTHSVTYIHSVKNYIDEIEVSSREPYRARRQKKRSVRASLKSFWRDLNVLRHFRHACHRSDVQRGAKKGSNQERKLQGKVVGVDGFMLHLRARIKGASIEEAQSLDSRNLRGNNNC